MTRIGGSTLTIGVLWDLEYLVKVAAGALEAVSAESDAEQAVRGVDALDEVDMHPILAEGFARAGFGVFREWPYPSLPLLKRGKTKTSERDRCDLVLTPAPGLSPRDPVAEARARAAAAATLFAGIVDEEVSAGCAALDCCWIEVKTVGQHVYRHGVPGPNAAYSSELTAAFATDLRKLGGERGVQHGVVLGVLFAASDEVLGHDVPIALHRCLDRGLSFGTPRREGFGIADRAGNRWCEVWGVPVNRPEPGLFE